MQALRDQLATAEGFAQQLQHVQASHGQFLLVAAVGRDVAALAVASAELAELFGVARSTVYRAAERVAAAAAGR